ncbi:MAG: hypothetical protein A2Y38_15200 [Spirochaetes bacterium GWB1_59_5]|nr:MAG: hypothetical protein A2Y38_15200 [Spirochaetes bacterium GWB1_59_5]
MRYPNLDATIEHLDNQDEDPYRDLDLMIALRQILTTRLTGYEMLLVHFAFDARRPVAEIAEICGISTYRVRQQVETILKRLRHELEE